MPGREFQWDRGAPASRIVGFISPVLTPQAFSVPEPGIWNRTLLAPAPVILWKMGGEVKFSSGRPSIPARRDSGQAGGSRDRLWRSRRDKYLWHKLPDFGLSEEGHPSIQLPSAELRVSDRTSNERRTADPATAVARLGRGNWVATFGNISVKRLAADFVAEKGGRL